jgi:general secretion pathway protein C
MKTAMKLNLQMRPSRLIVIVLLVILIFISVIYWAIRLRTVMTPVAPAVIAADAGGAPVGATMALFGTQPDTDFVGTNMQVSGVVIAPEPNDSIAILTESGRTRAFRIGAEITPGTHLAEVHKQYVIVSDGARTMRIDVPQISSQTGAAQSDAEGQPPENVQPAASPSGVGLRGEPPHSPTNAEPESAEPAADPTVAQPRP